jgi:hypothetical protein
MPFLRLATMPQRPPHMKHPGRRQEAGRPENPEVAFW